MNSQIHITQRVQSSRPSLQTGEDRAPTPADYLTDYAALRQECLRRRRENRATLRKTQRSPQIIRKQTKATFGKCGAFLASFNIKGRTYGSTRQSKFKDLATWMRNNRITFTCIQETHLTAELVTELNRQNPAIRIISNSTYESKEGIALVIMKSKVSKYQIKEKKIIPNRVSLYTVTLDDTNQIQILNVYAPNERTEKIHFYEKLNQLIPQLQLDKPNTLMCGDFNMVEDAMDRLPNREDSPMVCEAFNKVKNTLETTDGWRTENEYESQYTYAHAATGSASRIDRIYVGKQLIQNTDLWNIIETGKLSDHDAVTTSILPNNTPNLGKGTIKLALNLLDEPKFIKKAQDIINDYGYSMETYQNDYKNCKDNPIRLKKLQEDYDSPQKLYIAFKKELMKEANQFKTEIETKRTHKLKDSREKLKCAQQNLQKAKTKGEELTDYRLDILDKQKELNTLISERIQQSQTAAQAKHMALGEQCNKYWFGLNNTKDSSATITHLQKPNGSLTSKTKDMLNIAKKHHEDLQKAQLMTEEREQAIKDLLDTTKVKLSKKEKKTLGQKIHITELKEALKQTQNQKAPGPDGIPFEFYKRFARNPLKEIQDSLPDQAKTAQYDIFDLLNYLIQDIDTNGIQNKEFSEGQMFLLYKKKSKTQIENYRPVTLLNTDYKLYTKVIANRLGKIADTLIHPNQAGFVPGRSLYDQTKQHQLIIEYCKDNNIKGCILSLDQEKAYDRIDHNYLWAVLKHFNFPQSMITRLQQIYKDANTSCMVNNHKSDPFEVKRGVRQGDPMSCLLYDLAIEPLANAIRASKDLKGIQIKGLTDRILCNMFADDTTVHLTIEDKFSDLKKILDLFCLASTAKFNIGKTEILPVGPTAFRKTFIENGYMGDNPDNTFPNAKIIRDHEGMRVLGAWIGNEIDTHQQWNTIIEKQKQIMNVWNSTNPSYRGKELILKALIQSRALFLMVVNGIPEGTLERMQKQMKDFIWRGKRALMADNEIVAPLSKGGLNMPDLKLRATAIQIMWLKTYLAPEHIRPAWAWVADAILSNNIPKAPIIRENNRISWILQSWHESAGPKNTIPKVLKDILKVGRKYNVALDARQFSTTLKKKLPLFHHIAAEHNYLWNKKTGKCIRDNHDVFTVGEATTLANAQNNEHYTCPTTAKCQTYSQRLLDIIPNKWNPNDTTPYKSRIKQQNPLGKNQNSQNTSIQIHPSIQADGDPMEHVRIFRQSTTYKKRRIRNKECYIIEPAHREQPKDRPKKLKLYTDGSAKNLDSPEPRTGAGIWCKKHPELNKALRLEGPHFSNQRAELMAIFVALENQHDKISIRSDSLTSIEGIIHRLNHWEDKGWIGITNSDVLQGIQYRLLRRTAETKFKWVKAHENCTGNNHADRLANEGADKETTDKIDLTIPKEYQLDGAKLQSLTQRLCYQKLVDLNAKSPGNQTGRTNQILSQIQEEMEETTNCRPSIKRLWKPVGRHIIQPKVHDFLWKLKHDRVKFGSYFKRIPGFERFTHCNFCDQEETFSHIFFECENTKPSSLWKHLENVWHLITPDPWIKPNEGILKGLNALVYKQEKSQRAEGSLTKRYQSMVGLALWLIWLRRNDHLFNNKSKDIPLKDQWNTNMLNHIKSQFHHIKYGKGQRFIKIAEFQGIWCAEPQKETRRNKAKEHSEDPQTVKNKDALVKMEPNGWSIKFNENHILQLKRWAQMNDQAQEA